MLARVEDKAGFLPTAATRVSEIRSLEGAARTRYLLATAYHTAYVMGLLCAASLQPGYAPPVAIPIGGAKPGAAREILRLLDSGNESQHWRDEFRRLNDSEADALSGFLLSMALRRRVKKRDFPGLRMVLELADRLDLTESPVASQAAELLDRMAIYATFCAERDAEQALPATEVRNSRKVSAKATNEEHAPVAV